MKVALSTQADFIIPDLVQFKDNNTRIGSIIGFHGDRQKILTSKEAFIASLSWKISGVGMIRSNLLKKFGYDETAKAYSDEYSTRQFFLNSNKIVFSEGKYFYRQHSNSTTHQISTKKFDSLFTDFKILELANEYKIDDKGLNLCKKNIINNFLNTIKYLIKNKKNFTVKEINDIENQLRSAFNKIDSTYIQYEGNIIKWFFRKVLFMDYQILKQHSLIRQHLINGVKLIINIK
jgi:hypothetical protein